jgi:hypothetical protein
VPPSPSSERHHRCHRSPAHPRSKLNTALGASPRAALPPPSPHRSASTRHPTPPPHVRPGCPHHASPRCFHLTPGAAEDCGPMNSSTSEFMDKHARFFLSTGIASVLCTIGIVHFFRSLGACYLEHVKKSEQLSVAYYLSKTTFECFRKFVLSS